MSHIDENGCLLTQQCNCTAYIMPCFGKTSADVLRSRESWIMQLYFFNSCGYSGSLALFYMCNWHSWTFKKITNMLLSSQLTMLSLYNNFNCVKWIIHVEKELSQEVMVTERHCADIKLISIKLLV